MLYRCSNCGLHKKATAFYKDATKVERNGVGGRCKVCEKERRATPERVEYGVRYRRAKGVPPRKPPAPWGEEDKKKYHRLYAIQRRYGVSPEEVERLLEEQGGRCAICLEEVKVGGRDKESMVIDHCHTTGEVRGILCRSCNGGIGFFRDRREVMARAIAYLE